MEEAMRTFLRGFKQDGDDKHLVELLKCYEEKLEKAQDGLEEKEHAMSHHMEGYLTYRKERCDLEDKIAHLKTKMKKEGV